MKLIYADPHPIPDTLPAALQMLQTVDALGEIGLDVDVVSPEVRTGTTAAQILARELSPQVTLHYLPDIRKRWFFPFASHRPYWLLARQWIRRRKADALVVRNLKLADYLLRQPGMPPLFFESHEVFAQTYRELHPDPTAVERDKLAALERRERFVYTHAQGIVALTPYLLEDIRTHYGTPAHTLVAPDGVDLRLAATATPRRSDRTRLLYLGSLHPWKGVEVLLEALRQVPGADLEVVGGSRDRIRELTRLAHNLGVGARARFAGPVAPAERFAVIANADVCLLPSTNTSIGSRYTSPLKLFEYMAMGKPVVAGNLPAMRSVLQHGRNALLADPGSPAAFAACIRDILTSPALGRSLGDQARHDASDYAWTRRAERIGDFVGAVLAPRSRPSATYYGA